MSYIAGCLKKVRNRNNNMNELISVIMSTYHEPLAWIGQAVDSILSQTYKKIEFIIVVDDPDNTELIEYITKRKKQDSRIIMHINKKNIGLAVSLNIAIGLAKGEYIARMDADDISEPNRLACQMEYLIAHDLDLVGCNIRTMDESGKMISGGETRLPLSDEVIKKYLKIGNIIMHPTWLTKKNVYINLGMYHNFPAAQDYEFLTRSALAGYRLGNIKEPKLIYRINTNGISGTKKILQKSIHFFVRKNYAAGKQSRLEDFYAFIESDAGRKKQKELEKFCQNYKRRWKHCHNRKWYIFFVMGVNALLRPGEERIWFVDAVQGKLLRMRYREYR